MTGEVHALTNEQIKEIVERRGADDEHELDDVCPFCGRRECYSDCTLAREYADSFLEANR